MTKRAVIKPLFTSPVADPIARFLLFKRASGCRYRDGEIDLRVLDRFLAAHLAPEQPVITLGIVRAFVARKGSESETSREHRLCLIRQFCRFLALEDPRTAIPPPRYLGIARPPFLARVLTRDEGRRFLTACTALPPGHCSPLRGTVHGTALTLLYLTGLRAGEALNLNLEDVDLMGGVLRIRHGKFDKSRLVPIAADLAERLAECREEIDRQFRPRLETEPFFIGPKGLRCRKDALRASFRIVLAGAGIPYLGRGRGPRLHDLRHSFCSLRMLLWYEQNADLGAKLPILATYLGHVSLASSQRYLRLTEELVGEVTRRFDAHFGHLIVDSRTP